MTYNREHLKVVWERLAAEAGVRILLHAFLVGATVRDGRVADVLVATKAGLVRIAGSRRSSTPAAMPTSVIMPGSATSWPASSTRPRR